MLVDFTRWTLHIGQERNRALKRFNPFLRSLSNLRKQFVLLCCLFEVLIVLRCLLLRELAFELLNPILKTLFLAVLGGNELLEFGDLDLIEHLGLGRFVDF